VAKTTEYPVVENYDLAGSYIYPLWLRIELADGRLVFRQCHFYIVSDSNNVDMFRVVPGGGKMERFSIINNVDSVDEVEGPPEPDPAPVDAGVAVEVAAKAPDSADLPF